MERAKQIGVTNKFGSVEFNKTLSTVREKLHHVFSITMSKGRLKASDKDENLQRVTAGKFQRN